MSYREIERLARRVHLAIFGAFHATGEDDLPERARTLILLGPHEPGFWAYLKNQPELQDGEQDPVDRWTCRVVDTVAQESGTRAFYPFGGPPYHPFIDWALRSGRCWQSPVLFLVHDTAGLFVSFRAALAHPEKIDLPLIPCANPCESCVDKPCITSCPVKAVSSSNFNADRCRKHLGTPDGQDCLDRGCRVRRSCPVSVSYGRSEGQSRLHQKAFAGGS